MKVFSKIALAMALVFSVGYASSAHAAGPEAVKKAKKAGKKVAKKAGKEDRKPASK